MTASHAYCQLLVLDFQLELQQPDLDPFLLAQRGSPPVDLQAISNLRVPEGN